MRKNRPLKYFSLWQVDYANAGAEQELFNKLKLYLLKAAHYLCIPVEEEPFLDQRMSVQNAVDIMAPALGMKTLARSSFTDIKYGALPLLVREGQELLLLLPHDYQNYAKIKADGSEELVAIAQINKQYAEIIEFYAANPSMEKIHTQAFNSQVKGFLPQALIFSLALIKICLIAFSLGAMSLLFKSQRWPNELSLLIVMLSSGLSALIIDLTMIKSAHKNILLIKMWSLSQLYQRIFSMNISEQVRASLGTTMVLRKTMVERITSFYAKTPACFDALALLLINFLWLLVVKASLAWLLLLVSIVSGFFGWWLHKYYERLLEHRNESELKFFASMSCIEASFAMAQSLKSLGPISGRLSKNAEMLAKAHTKVLLVDELIFHAKWFFPLLTLLVALVVATNAPSLLVLLDSLLIGAALAKILWLGRDFSPLTNKTIALLNTFHDDKGHKLKPVNIKGDIELDNISFSYPDSGLLVLHNFNLNIKAGALVGIMGPSGSGKTTLLHILMAQEEVARGQVIFDGQDQKGLNLQQLRSNFGVVGASSSIFAGSLLDNILCGRLLPLSTISDLLYSHAIYDALLDFPMGLQTYVFSEAHNLSRLQQVLVLLARALIHKPKILYMDEIFKGIDASEQAMLKEYLKSLTMTRIIVSHHSLKDLACDQLIELMK